MTALDALRRRLSGDAYDRIFALALALTLAATLLGYPLIAEQVPIHFSGRELRPDRYLGKPLGPFVLTGVAALLYLLVFPLLGTDALAWRPRLHRAVRAMQLALALLLLAVNLVYCFRPDLLG